MVEDRKDGLIESWQDTTDGWATPSIAIVACHNGQGVVLWYGGGPSLAYEIEEAGMRRLDQLYLDDAPDGISVWEGCYITTGGNCFGIDDVEVNAEGAFRKPTAREWRSIMAGRNPFKKRQKKERRET